MQREKENDIQMNLMTQQTLERLRSELDRAVEDEDKYGKQIGEAAGDNCDWHDNAAYDYAQTQFQVATTRVNTLKSKLDNVEIIKPRQETETIGIGNAVKVKYSSEDEAETFTVLGPDDGLTGRDDGWISCETPLAKVLIGKKQGDTVELDLGDTKEKVKILEIKPGDF